MLLDTVRNLDGIFNTDEAKLMNNILADDMLLRKIYQITFSAPPDISFPGYYEATLRNLDEQEDMWMLLDNILKCVALPDAFEAERVMNLLVGSTLLINAKSHIASVLEDMQSIALVHRGVVARYRPWVATQAEDPFLMKTAAKLLLIIDNGGLANMTSASSAVCSVQ